MSRVTSGMLAISQKTLMKLLEMSKKRVLTACLAASSVMLQFYPKTKERM